MLLAWRLEFSGEKKHFRGRGVGLLCLLQWLPGKASVNEALVSRGLGSVEEVRGFKSSEGHAKFMEAMGRREREARGRGWGVWEGHRDVALWRKAVRFWRRKRRRES